MGEEKLAVAKKKNGSNQDSFCSLFVFQCLLPWSKEKGLFQKTNGTIWLLKLLVAVKCHKYFSAEIAIGFCTPNGEWSLRTCNLNRPTLARGSICYPYALFTPTAFKYHTGDLSVDCLLSLVIEPFI